MQQVVDSVAGTTTTTSYVGSLETYSITTSSGPTLITTTDYVSAGKVLAESVNGTLSYLATSYQGSVVEALDSTGNVGVTASQLYVPYGGIRYLSGALPTDYGYTGQRRDASSGLDYYGARYYDPTVGQFTSADTVLQGGGLSICGLNRYAYVKDNPETLTDPSGNCPQKPQEFHGWKKVLVVTNLILEFIAALVSGQLFNPLGEARASQGGYGGSSDSGTKVQVDEPQASNTATPNGNTIAGGGDDNCDDDRRIRIDPPWQIIVRMAGKIVAKVSRDGRTATWNRQARRHPKSQESEASEPGQQSKQAEAELRYRQRLMDLNMNETRAGPEPFQQRLIDLNNTGPADPTYVPWDPSTWAPDLPWWLAVPVAGPKPSGAPSAAGGGISDPGGIPVVPVNTDIGGGDMQVE